MQPQVLAMERAHCNSPDMKVKAFLPSFGPGQSSERQVHQRARSSFKRKDTGTCVMISALLMHNRN